jgi:hypothetical protein
MTTDNPSVTIASIIDSGHEIEMPYCDEETQKINAQIDGYQPLTIRLRAATEDDDTVHQWVEERVEDGEIIVSRGIGQGGITRLVENRHWTVDKQ